MTEDEAREWVASRYGGPATERLAAFLDMVAAENHRQNLVAPSTIAAIWTRHAMDSAQLVPLGQPGIWIDIGTGGGFPGMVVALLRSESVLMVEPRKRRAAFLEECRIKLDLTNARVVPASVEKLSEQAATISARAVASVEKLLQIGAGCANENTRWLLPRGRVDEGDLTFLKRHWQGVFHVEQSLTDAGSSILVLDGSRL